MNNKGVWFSKSAEQVSFLDPPTHTISQVDATQSSCPTKTPHPTPTYLFHSLFFPLCFCSALCLCVFWLVLLVLLLLGRTSSCNWRGVIHFFFFFLVVVDCFFPSLVVGGAGCMAARWSKDQKHNPVHGRLCQVVCSSSSTISSSSFSFSLRICITNPRSSSSSFFPPSLSLSHQNWFSWSVGRCCLDGWRCLLLLLQYCYYFHRPDGGSFTQ